MLQVDITLFPSQRKPPPRKPADKSLCMCFLSVVITSVFVCCCFFASVSPVPSICPSWSHTALNVQTVPVCMEGLGMATSLVRPGHVLLTGGCSRGGRGEMTRILLRGQEGWKSVSVEPSVDLGKSQ